MMWFLSRYSLSYLAHCTASCQKSSFVRLSVTVSVIVYVMVIPSAVFFYKYTPANEIVDDICPATNRSTVADRLTLCPLIPEKLDKSLPIDLHLDQLTPASIPGGAWKPASCISRHHVAIVIPYRNRESQLHIFLNHMHNILQSQMLDYRIVLVEQSPEKQFNRAALFNVGFLESLKISKYHCFIFHDIDLLPMNAANMYVCSINPRHMSVAINTMRFVLVFLKNGLRQRLWHWSKGLHSNTAVVYTFRLPYTDIFGGAVAMTYQQFTSVNGFSNLFYGWGGEDDDMFNRILSKGMKISRWDPRICRYFMLSHTKEMPNKDRHSLLASGEERYTIDGINSVKYEVIRHQELDLVTRILVRLL